jgi:hypothetical protein
LAGAQDLKYKEAHFAFSAIEPEEKEEEETP